MMFDNTQTTYGKATLAMLLVLVLPALATAGTIPSVSGLRARFAADGDVYNTGTTQATDGQAVETWADAAGADDDATQTTPAEQPVWIENGIDVGGGQFLPVVRFSDDYLEMNSVADVLSGTNQDMTVVAVVKFNGTARITLTGFGNSTTTTPFHQIRPTSVAEGDQYLMQRRGDGGTNLDVQDGNVGRPGNDYVVLMAVDTGTLASMFVDGSAVFENQNIGVGVTSVNQAVIGALPLGANRWDQLDGDIAELLIFDTALSAVDQNAIGFYLGNKYSIDTAYVVPEPGSFMLVVTGLLGLMMRRRSRK